MKKNILFIIMFLLLASSILATFSTLLVPFPFGQEIIIDDVLGSNLMIKIENKEFDTIRTTTNEEGQFLVDLANFGYGYSDGDIIKVTVYRDNEQRTYDVIIDKEEGGMFFRKLIKWDQDEKTYTESEKDPGFEIVINIIQENREKDQKFLQEERKKDEAQNIKERNWSILIAVVSILVSLLFFFGSWGVTKYYAEKQDCKYVLPKVKKFKKNNPEENN